MKPIKAKYKNGFISPELFFQPTIIKIKHQPTNLLYRLYRRSPLYDFWTLLSSPIN